NWSYLALPCEAQDLPVVLEGLRAVGCRGLNVTIPHKQNVVDLCRELAPLAERLQAVNTLIPLGSGGWQGANTDVEGFLAPLKERRNWQGQRALVIGNGGSARAVVAGLQTLGLESLTVVGRRQDALAGFITELSLEDAPVQACLGSDQGLQDLIQSSDLVVNTTPVGMAQHGDADALPLGLDLWTKLAQATTLYDLIYTPRPTAWLALGQRQGLHCIDGLEMLVQQGAAALRLWTQQADIPIEAMRQAALAELAA
ncbi:MAG: shikimate dehydrogenase, partial [Synechococcus sp.]|nr:shikimate dehydrogenase [Synechococcus sp.]